MLTHDELVKKALEDPEVRAEYERIEREEMPMLDTILEDLVGISWPIGVHQVCRRWPAGVGMVCRRCVYGVSRRYRWCMNGVRHHSGSRLRAIRLQA
ncbi:hypothetical protein [Castellaniella caeni]|uniref:hypothetical protein n=1 Tax=Castellaniella caeni TaxID=266123 RepID=UPI0018DCCAC7|nr:hypothetical protein [Castellaniella caeni]